MLRLFGRVTHLTRRYGQTNANHVVRRGFTAKQPLPISTLNKRERFDAKLFFGRMGVDDNILRDSTSLNQQTALDELRERANKATLATDFVHIALSAVRWMETLPTGCPLRFPAELAFINRPSPVFPIFERGLSLIFRKVLDNKAKYAASATSASPNTSDGQTTLPTSNLSEQQNNGSGMALGGPRGVGKSNLLRLLTLVPPLLFPQDLLTVYIDFSSYSKDKISLRQLLAASLYDLHPELGDDLAKTSHIEEVLDLVTYARRKVIVASDNMGETYGHDVIWKEYECLATGYSTCLFVADSGSKVRAMVERNGHEHKLKQWFPQFDILPSSLNQDKLKVETLNPFTSKEQYQVYLKCRKEAAAPLPLTPDSYYSSPNLSAAAAASVLPPTAEQHQDMVINALHLMSGGRVRAMKAESRVVLPPMGDIERYIIECLTSAQGQTPFDPFNMVSVSEDKVLEWLLTWQKNNPHATATLRPGTGAGPVDVNTLMDANILTFNPRTGKYSFAVPMHYFLQRALQPRVFLLHATDRPGIPGDNHSPIFGQLRLLLETHGADVTVCEAEDSQNSVTYHNLMRWMSGQTALRANHYVIIILSPKFAERTREAKSGCRTELAYALANRSKEAHLTANLVAVSLNEDYQPSWAHENTLITELADSTFIRTLKDTNQIVSLVHHIMGNIPTTPPTR